MENHSHETYDLASRLTSALCGRYNTLVQRGYDLIGRQTSETLSVDGQPFTTYSQYDAASRRSGITYPSGKQLTHGYTPRSQLAQVNYDGALVANLGYDAGMRQTTKAFTNGKTETRSYRLDNRLSQITVPGVTDFAYSYDANKNPTSKAFAPNRPIRRTTNMTPKTA
jgi:uncharacterized protein RhaS with RHS repeats